MTLDLLARMRDSLQLNGLSVKTQDAYLRAVRLLCAHSGCAPDQITEEHLRRYFLYRRNESRWSPSTLRISFYGVRFFFEHVLPRDWMSLALLCVSFSYDALAVRGAGFAADGDVVGFPIELRFVRVPPEENQNQDLVRFASSTPPPRAKALRRRPPTTAKRRNRPARARPTDLYGAERCQQSPRAHFARKSDRHGAVQEATRAPLTAPIRSVDWPKSGFGFPILYPLIRSLDWPNRGFGFPILFQHVETLSADDQETVIKIIDAMLAKQRVESALVPLDR